jgi:hypothetical protein
MNFLRAPQTVRLALPGRALDLLSAAPVDLGRIHLAPLEPVLLEVVR